MNNGINSKASGENSINMNDERQLAKSVSDLEDGKFYHVGDLQSILKEMGLTYSIFTIRDYETWKCLNYECGKRSNEAVEKCPKCEGEVRAPIIESPRTLGGGKGVGHRRYTGEDIKKIVEVFSKRN